MFRIGAFSKLTRVSVRMLRYYDNAGLLTPAVIDKFTGYRMYTTDQIPVLQKICLLRDMGFNVTEIGAVMECWESSDRISGGQEKTAFRFNPAGTAAHTEDRNCHERF